MDSIESQAAKLPSIQSACNVIFRMYCNVSKFVKSPLCRQEIEQSLLSVNLAIFKIVFGNLNNYKVTKLQISTKKWNTVKISYKIHYNLLYRQI